jgi:predicted dinucleotide-binding enzyme
VARALALRWFERGWSVTFGSRNPTGRGAEILAPFRALERSADGASEIEGMTRPRVACIDLHQCVKQHDLLLLAVPWRSAIATLEQVEQGADEGKRRVVIDCINPLRADLGGRDIPADASTLSLLSVHYPNADFVKAFNCASSAVLGDSEFPEGRPSMPYCGDSAEACRQVVRLIEAAGFEPIDCGGSDAAAWLETMALLTIRMAIRNGWKGDCAVRWERR